MYSKGMISFWLDCGGRQGIDRKSNHGESETQKEKGPESLPLIEKLREAGGCLFSLEDWTRRRTPLARVLEESSLKQWNKICFIFSDSKQADKKFLKPSNTWLALILALLCVIYHFGTVV